MNHDRARGAAAAETSHGTALVDLVSFHPQMLPNHSSLPVFKLPANGINLIRRFIDRKGELENLATGHARMRESATSKACRSITSLAVYGTGQKGREKTKRGQW